MNAEVRRTAMSFDLTIEPVASVGILKLSFAGSLSSLMHRSQSLQEPRHREPVLRRRLNETRHREIFEARRRCLSRADRAECVSDRTRDAAKVNLRVVAHLMGSTTNAAPVVETGAVSLERGVDAMSRRRFAWRHSPRFIATTDLFAIRSAEPQEPVT